MGAPSRKKGMTEKRRHRAVEVLKKRRQGFTYAEIGRQLGVSEATAYQDYKKSMEEITREPAQAVLEMELDRLDQRLLEANMRAALLRSQEKEGTIAPDRAHASWARIDQQRGSIAKQRARLLGLETVRPDRSAEAAAALSSSFELLADAPLEELDPYGEF